MITKFKQYNEGINHLLVGPTNEDIWSYYMEGDLKGLIKSIPTSPEDFFNQIKDECVVIGGSERGDIYGKNRIKLFQQNLINGFLWVSDKYIWSILEKVYGFNYTETQSFINKQLVDTEWNRLIALGSFNLDRIVLIKDKKSN